MQRLSFIVMLAIAAASATYADPPVCSLAQVFPNISSEGLRNGGRAIDVDGDGHPELVVWDFDSLRVLSASASGQFSAVPGMSIPMSFELVDVAGADVDGNGHVDLVGVGCFSTDHHQCEGFYQVFLNDGTALAPQRMQPFGAKLVGATLSDLDGDNHVDLVITTADVRTSIGILKGDGAGSFQLATELDGGIAYGRVVVGDVTRDGLLDVVVPDGGDEVVRVFPGVRGFSFAAPTDYPSGNSPFALIWADLNGDQINDIFVEGSPNMSVLFGESTGGFQAVQKYVPYLTLRATIGDVDADGDLDVVGFDPKDVWSGHRVAVFKNDGRGQLSPPERLIVGRGVDSSDQQLVAGDFDGDGLTDLAGPLGSGRIAFVRGGGKEGFFAPRSLDGPAMWWMNTGDVDNDGDLDIVGGTDAPNIQVRLNDGKGGFSSAAYGLGTTGYSHQPVLVDLNGDGLLDLVVTNGSFSQSAKDVVLMLGHGDGTFTPLTAMDTGFLQAFEVAVADLDGDGDLDLAMSVHKNNGVFGLVIFLNAGDLTFGAPMFYLTDGAWSVNAADLDGDQLPEIVVSDPSAPKLWIFKYNGDGTFTQRAIQLAASGTARTAALADIDGDGDIDVVVVRETSLQTVINDGRGALVASTTLVPIPQGGYAIELVDVTNDGVRDAVVGLVNDEDGICLLEGHADGTFTFLGFFSGYLTGDVIAGDFDGDGDVDIIGANANTVLYESVLSTMQPADLDCDGSVGAADLGIMLGAWGRCGARTSCAADLNGDGVVDASDLSMLLGSWG